MNNDIPMDQSSNRNKKRAFIACGLVVIVGLFVVMKDSFKPKTPLAENAFVDPATGASADAPLVIKEYSDFQCPACRAADAPLHAFMQRHEDVVRLEYNDFPLKQVHRNAYVAALAANCADEQGVYWAYHDKLFDRQDDWSKLVNPNDIFAEIMNGLNGDGQKLKACVAEKKYREPVDADIDEGLSLDIGSTPTFFVNGERHVGGLTLADWEALLVKAMPKESVGPRK